MGKKGELTPWEITDNLKNKILHYNMHSRIAYLLSHLPMTIILNCYIR